MAIIDFLPDRLNNPPRGVERFYFRGVCAGGPYWHLRRHPASGTTGDGSLYRLAGISDVHAADAANRCLFWR